MNKFIQEVYEIVKYVKVSYEISDLIFKIAFDTNKK